MGKQKYHKFLVYAITAAAPGSDATAKDDITHDGKLIYINTEFGDAWLDDSEQVSALSLFWIFAELCNIPFSSLKT